MLRRLYMFLASLVAVTSVGLVGAGDAYACHSPSTPTGLSAIAGDGQVLVSWTPSFACFPLTSYAVRAFDGGTLVSTTTVTGSPPATSSTVTGLTNGTAYTFTVSATSIGGSSPQSSASSAVTPVGPPAAPTSVSASATDATLTVSWGPPTSNGGSAVTGYVATLAPGGATCTGSAGSTTCVVSGLTNGTSYSATVQATNAVGTGSASAGASATPLPAPPAPAVLTSSGTGTAVQSVAVVVPTGHSVTLLDGLVPVTALTVGGQGTYAVGSGGGTLTFTPADGFVGTATAATYRLTDSHGQQGSATYTPTVQAPTPAPVPPVPTTDPAPAPTTNPAPAPTVSVTVPAPVLTLAGRGGSVPVRCASSAGTVTGCEVTLYANADGRRVVVGSGTHTGAGTVEVHLTRRGLHLVERPGGRRLHALAAIAVDDATPLTARTTVTVVPERIVVRRTVRFDAGSEDLRRAAAAFAGSLGRRLEGVRAVTCIGHTDDRGPRAYNADLSLHRARAVCDLVAAGLDVRRRVEGRGEAHPVATNSTSAGRAANRRVVIVLGY